ncbi:hypothetical protein VNO78_28876 [Psophocarpus tetragonolobus]|uniref:Uncharacterized protein n=1 Tax=Psophocarpus tetragonolobus TaxID=3891 RepID=A0AAN9WZ80_PSOTE
MYFWLLKTDLYHVTPVGYTKWKRIILWFKNAESPSITIDYLEICEITSKICDIHHMGRSCRRDYQISWSLKGPPSLSLLLPHLPLYLS